MIRFADQPERRWRDGGGATRELAVGPPSLVNEDGFAWRISVATIDADGPFSRFDGVDRSLLVLWR
ncbi:MULTISPECIES: HutD family protein [unclassified Sphingobium]|uniref:HutD family protein n=1 Tax=unclassified Sphingobium TaxID=2611147 RepID=UPI00044CFE6A|nr:HutD family protein [Sphingobium sp. Ant17]EXS68700.1 hypothetical protein BF95_00495 [Sphingobium sp. Ant17]